MFGVLALVVVANAAQFLWLGPPSDSTVGRALLYRDRGRLQRVLSDLEAITMPTAWTINESDRRVAMLQQFVARTCPSGAAIIVAGERITANAIENGSEVTFCFSGHKTVRFANIDDVTNYTT